MENIDLNDGREHSEEGNLSPFEGSLAIYRGICVLRQFGEPGQLHPSNTMPASYIPTKDADAVTWSQNFSDLITANPTDFGLVAGNAVTIAAVVTPWVAAYATAINPSTRTPASVTAKDNARAAMEAVCRPFAVQVSLNAGVTDENKTALGVTVRKTTPTPIPEPTTRPSLTLSSAQFNLQTIRYSDADLPTGKAKPPGAIGMELWVAVGTVPAIDPAQASFSAIVTKSPYNLPTNPADRGKVITMFGRWSTRGGSGGRAKVGPWSDPLISTVV